MSDETLRSVFKTLTSDERALFVERAAIMEFDADMSNENANREALWDVVRQRNHSAE